MLPILQLGPLAIQTPGLILLMGVWLGLTFAEKQAPRSKIEPHQLSNLILLGLVAGILGARLTYALQHFSAFVKTPLNILALSPTMLNPFGGLLVGILTMLIYGQRKKIPVFPALDSLTPFLMVLQIVLGLSNLASGEGYGLPTRMPWGIELWGAFRHPSQIYEIIAGLFILGLIQIFRSGKDMPGLFFFRFLALSAAARLFLEAYRGDSILLAGNIRLAQVTAWILMTIAFWQLGRLIQQGNRADHDTDG